MSYSEQNIALSNLSALIDFSKLINSSLDVNFTLNNLLLTCFGKFHTTKGFIALLNDNNKLEIKLSKGFPQSVLQKLPDNVSPDNRENNPAFNEFLQEIKASLHREIITSEGFTGYLVLGERLIKRDYTREDLEFIDTLLNIGATAIENSIAVDKIRKVNKELDAKVNQLSALFDLSKEFSGILKQEMVGKLLVYSIIGQMMVSRYAVFITGENSEFITLENKFPGLKPEESFGNTNIKNIKESLTSETIEAEYKPFAEAGVELVVPMQLQGENKGFVFLGKRISGQNYTKTDIEYVYSIGSLAIVSIENARLFQEMLEKQNMEKDLELARNIQQNLLPKKIPHTEKFEITAYNNSAKKVGGDYYDIIKLDENHILISIADVSGKGVQAALLVANLQAFIKSICKQNLPLDNATGLINDLVSENTIMGSFITFFWGIIDTRDLTFTYVNAGHNPPLLNRKGELLQLKTGGMIIGVMETMIPYASETITFQSGDSLVLFTDGITEAMNKENEEFSDERLNELLLENGNKSAKDFLTLLIDEIKDFTSGTEQSDDITALIVKVK